MKKIVCLLVLILLFSAAAGCARQRETLSFEEIMSLSNTAPACVESGIEYGDFQEFVSEFSRRNIGLSLVTASVKDVSHCLVWNKESAAVEGYTETEICIDNVYTHYNGLSLNVGDTVILKQNYYICFEEEGRFVSYVAKNINKKINTAEKLSNADSFTFKIELFKDEKYKKFIYEDEMPLKKGETYSMAVCKPSDSNDEYYNCYYVTPINTEISIASFESSYGFKFSDVYKSISEEISKRFSGDSQGRMSLQEVREIIAENDGFKDILDALYRRQEPDAVYGSGVTLIEFWLDPYGDEMIHIIKEQGQIYYEYKNNGDTSSELIYGPHS